VDVELAVLAKGDVLGVELFKAEYGMHELTEDHVDQEIPKKSKENCGEAEFR